MASCLTTAFATALAAAWTPAPPPVRVVGSWPPPAADPRHTWTEGVSAGPLGRAPDALFERLFRSALASEFGRDSPRPGFAGIVQLVQQLVSRRGAGSTAASRRVLVSLFPDWPPVPDGTVMVTQTIETDSSGRRRRGLLYWFEVLFARPLPAFAAKLNARVTFLAGQWLMGPCSVEDLSAEDAAEAVVGDGVGQQLLVHRCRFLEETACASVCVNACKMPTQAFFNEDMGVPLRMVPDYDTLECRFKFGLRPGAEDEAEARGVACFAACPSAGSLRSRCEIMGEGEGEG